MVNTTILQGRLVADPDFSQTQNGVGRCEFTVAWSEKYGEKETKCFLRCRAWRSGAEFISKYFRKGQEIVVDGKLSTDEWEKDGKKQSRTVLTVNAAHFCGPKQESAVRTSYAPVSAVPDVPYASPSAPDDFAEIADNEDLPF